MREGELLGGQRLQDLTHQPPAGAHAWPQSGPQWAAAQNQPVTVSTVLPATQSLLRPRRRIFSLSVRLSTQLPAPPRSAAMEVAVETRGEAEVDVQPESRDSPLLRQQRALLPEARSIMGKSRGERKGKADGEAGAEH